MIKKLRKPRPGTRGPTVADVARHAGVSPMTVSRVINREPNVLPATRAKVDEAIAALGYVPNAAARSLAAGQQCRIALLHANPSAAYLSEVLMGSLAQASQIDAQLIVEHCELDEDPQALVRRLAGHRVDAVLLPPPLCDDAALVAALGARISKGRACSAATLWRKRRTASDTVRPMALRAAWAWSLVSSSMRTWSMVVDMGGVLGW